MLYLEIILFLLCIAAYAWWGEPRRLQLTTHRIAGEMPFRALFISDLHVGRFNSVSVLVKHLQKLRSLQSLDALLLGGDFLDAREQYLPQLERVLREIASFNLPTYAVLGNHDYTSCPNISVLTDLLKEYGITVLINEVVQVGGITLIGVDDLEEIPGYRKGLQFIKNSEYITTIQGSNCYARLAENTVLPILMTHNPDGVYLPGPQPLVVLAGHTHGGQIFCIDWIGRTIPHLIHAMLPAGSFRTRAGKYNIEGRALIVNRGIAGSVIPARLFRRPEAVIVEVVESIGV